MKKGLCFGLAALVAGFMATSAGAAVDLDADTGTATYASEITVNSTDGTALANAGALNTNVELGFGAAVDDQRFLRFNLDNNAEFLNAGTALGLTVDGAAGVLAQGGAGESYVIFSWTATADATADAPVVLTFDASGVNVFNKEDVNISYALYETAGDAVSEANAISDEDGVLLEFDSALAVTKDAVTTEKIDVVASSKTFEGGLTTTKIGDVNVAASGALWTDGAAADLTDIVTADTDLVVEGDFSATQNLTAGEPDGTFDPTNVFSAANGDCTDNVTVGNISPADALTTTSATFAIGANPVADAAVLCMTVNGVSAMSQTTFTGLYDVVAVEDTSDATDVDLGALSTLTKNGTTARLPFALTPNGAYPYFVRIVNPSNDAGKVYMTLINDEGVSADFDVSTVANVAGFVDGELPAGASTGLININDAFAAAQAADSTFDLADTSNKLRINVEAEFGSVADSNGVIVNAFSLSQDGGTFNMVE